MQHNLTVGLVTSTDDPRPRTWERAWGRAPTPIVALTASVMAEDVRWALEAGCDAHVAKPVKKPALLEAIERHARADRVPLPAGPGGPGAP